MSTSYWMKETKKEKHYPKIEEAISANIVIIGAGLTGLSTAYYLANTTTDIVILESDKVGYGASGRNTGKITFQHGPLYHKLIEKYDKVFASKYYHAQLDAMRSIEAIIEEHHIACGYEKRDAFLYTADVTKIYEMQDEYQAYQDLGIEAEYRKEGNDPIPYQAGILIHEQAAYNPYEYCLGLSDVLDEQKIRIFEQSPVRDVLSDAQGGYQLMVNEQIVHANKVIFACQFPFIDHMHFYFARMLAIQENLMHATTNKPFTSTMIINIDEHLHSANQFHGQLVLSGNKQRSGAGFQEDYEKYQKSLYQLYPIQSIEGEWTNEDYLSFDELPLIGKLEKDNDDLLFASGFNAWGNTTSNMAAKILCAYVIDQYSTYAMLVSPQRSSFLTLPFLKENLKTAFAFISSKMKMGDISYPMKKQAKQIELDGHLYGAYRDEEDELYIVDITCPHMGCTCSFNHVDKTWDCPCHGSRFSYRGEIIKGPSCHCLRPYGDDLNTVDPHVIK